MTPRTIEIIEGAEPRDRPRAEALRKPGDYEAFVSQGRITRHAKEHLATSDKGVALFRRRLRTDIRALAAGNPPYRASDHLEAPIPTYAGDNVLCIPPVDGMDDAALILEVSRAVCEDHRIRQRPPGRSARYVRARRADGPADEPCARPSSLKTRERRPGAARPPGRG